MANTNKPNHNWPDDLANIIDHLPTEPSSEPFSERLRLLNLSPVLKAKIRARLEHSDTPPQTPVCREAISEHDESELALEVLLFRHRFTEIVIRSRSFRQAAISIVQNIYLFQQRKIFFSSKAETTEQERQEALLLLSSRSNQHLPPSLPLAKTFQHLIIARVWRRILTQSTAASRQEQDFRELHDTVAGLNAVRNIYIILSKELVHQFIRSINPIYRQSITPEDAFQIGCFGIARAAYRYHPSCGVRFAVFASPWVKKEIQRQSLENRLIRLSSNIIERYAKAAKTAENEVLEQVTSLLNRAQVQDIVTPENVPAYQKIGGRQFCPVHTSERKQLQEILLESLETTLPAKAADILRRRFGLPPYDREQSVIQISRTYGVTRSAIYQIEQQALKKLRKRLAGSLSLS